MAAWRARAATAGTIAASSALSPTAATRTRCLSRLLLFFCFSLPKTSRLSRGRHQRERHRLYDNIVAMMEGRRMIIHLISISGVAGETLAWLAWRWRGGARADGRRRRRRCGRRMDSLATVHAFRGAARLRCAWRFLFLPDKQWRRRGMPPLLARIAHFSGKSL